ncbi:MAG: flagellar basal body P-ring protein FlgI [Candidatus Sedimenticola sp. (ex Thyasira tokunagai)]
MAPAFSPTFLISYFDMRMKSLVKLLLFVMALSFVNITAASVRIKDLSRNANATDNSLVGYGLVTGLAGTGDSQRSAATNQSIINMLHRFGLKLDERLMRSRNVAAVMIIASLPPYAQIGDKLDINVTSIGDARSLLGGTLFRTDLKGADGQIYALAQGPLSIGGFQYDFNGNLVQKNHPTAGTVTGGAIVQRSVDSPLTNDSGVIDFVLHNADLTTASRIANVINREFGRGVAKAINSAKVRVQIPEEEQANSVTFLSRLERLLVNPDSHARVVINERTGTVVSGGLVIIAPVSLTHGDLMLNISTEYQASQPTLVARVAGDVRTAVVSNTDIQVKEEASINLTLKKNTTISQLVTALRRVRATPRDIITILQAIKRAGALHAQLVIQ